MQKQPLQSCLRLVDFSSLRRLNAVAAFEMGQVGRSSPKECLSGAVDVLAGHFYSLSTLLVLTKTYLNQTDIHQTVLAQTVLIKLVFGLLLFRAAMLSKPSNSTI